MARCSTKLAVLASASVDRGVDDRLIPGRLAAHTSACTGQRLTTPVRNPIAAIFAIFTSVACRHSGPSRFNCVLYCIVNLILNRPIP